MDRLKFRAWDEHNKKMFKPFDMVERLESTEPFLRGLKYLQSTGLVDRGGELIFEGDILNLEHEHDQQQGFVVGDNADSFFDDVSYLGVFDEEQREIIGNIYENPELLEEGK